MLKRILIRRLLALFALPLAAAGGCPKAPAGDGDDAHGTSDRRVL